MKNRSDELDAAHPLKKTRYDDVDDSGENRRGSNSLDDGSQEAYGAISIQENQIDVENIDEVRQKGFICILGLVYTW